MDAATIAAAFKLPGAKGAALARDASPLSGGGTPLTKNLIIAVVVIVFLVVMLKDCSRSNCDELRASFGQASNEYRQCLNSGSSGSAIPRTGGGSFGGFGGGGGHK